MREVKNTNEESVPGKRHNKEDSVISVDAFKWWEMVQEILKLHCTLAPVGNVSNVK